MHQALPRTAALTGVSETLLITLAARLLAGRQNPDLRFADPAAEAVGQAIGFDPARFAGDRASMRGSVVRGQWFDHVTRRFLDAHRDGLIVSIGSGLDTRANRMPLRHGVDWVDIDMPEVVALRGRYVPGVPHVRTLAADGTDVRGWADRVNWRDGRPVMVLAEGVSMYLQPEQARFWLGELVATAHQRGSHLTLALDLASPLMASQSRRHPSVAQTGARFAWGVARPSVLCDLAPGLRLVETFDVARRSGLTSSMIAAAYRLLTLGRPIYSCAAFTNH